jgi:N-acetylglucosaminyldiphosphoundecaprenol N-acetyl-beta-D-mannosaminyltransferase
MSVISIAGPATGRNIDKITASFVNAAGRGLSVEIDLSKTTVVDARFLGLLLVLNKKLKSYGARMNLTGLTPSIKRIFHLNNLAFLSPPGSVPH